MPPVPPMPLRLEAVLDADTARLTVVGELTYSTAAAFGAQVADVLAALRPRLLLDMSRLHFCDSIGLSALIGVQRQAELSGVDLALSGVHGSLARNLSVTGAAVLFEIVGPLDRTDAPPTGYAGGRS